MKFLAIALLALLAPHSSFATESGAHAKPSVEANSAASNAQVSEADSAALNPEIARYVAHLQSLLPLVSGCATARNVIACNSSNVGSDDEIVFATGEHRMIRYGWLRALLEKAQKPDAVEAKQKQVVPSGPVGFVGSVKDKQAPANPAAEEKAEKKNQETDDEDKPPVPGDFLKIPTQPLQATTTELLKRASDRLTGDLEEAQKYTVAQVAPHTKEHEALKQVLTEAAFRNLNTNTPKNRFLEKLLKWINAFFEKISSFGASAPWLGKALLIIFFVLVGVALIWSLIQSERRLRLRLTPEGGFFPGAGAASARDWQLWLKDADSAAAAGEWREAIHFIYWASISRLESLRLWPADRARTPREYLALVKIDDPRRNGLQSLTRSFERTWYGGRMAEEAEYKAASEIAKNLIQSGGSR